MSPDLSLKEQLRVRCIEFVRARIEASEDAIRVLQLSANEETKSSAGDKYETGRAMAQLEIEKHQEQLGEARKMMSVLNQIVPTTGRDIHLGRLAITNQGNFYIAVSAGKILLDGETYFAISLASPIGQYLAQGKVESGFVLNGKEFKILRVL